MKKALIVCLIGMFFVSGCAHVSEYGFIDQKLKKMAINNSVVVDSKVKNIGKFLKDRNVALVATGIVEKEQTEHVKAIIEKSLTDSGVIVCSLDKAEFILNIRVDVLGTIQDDEHFGFLYFTSKRIGQTRIHLSLKNIKSNSTVMSDDDLRGSSMWTELYILWVFGPIRSYIENIDYEEYK